jgi:hypothetical protein
MSAGSGDQERPPTEEELRAAYEAEIKQIRVEQIVLENVVTLINLGMRRTGLIPGTEDERDPTQVQVAIEAVRSHLPLVEAVAGPQAQQIRDALSQLQMAFVQITGGTPEEAAAAGGATPPAQASPGAPAEGASPQPPRPDEPVTPGEPGPAQRSGRLWIPGQ